VASVSGPAGARSRGRPRLPKAATRRPMPCTPGTPRAPSRHACTLRTGGPSTVVLARAFPRRPSSVRRSLGGSHVAYLTAAAPGRDAQALPAAPEPHTGALGPVVASSNFRPTTSQSEPSSTYPSSYRRYQAAPPFLPGPNLAGV
jgi:hypothetical protein